MHLEVVRCVLAQTLLSGGAVVFWGLDSAFMLVDGVGIVLRSVAFCRFLEYAVLVSNLREDRWRSATDWPGKLIGRGWLRKESRLVACKGSDSAKERREGPRENQGPGCPG